MTTPLNVLITGNSSGIGRALTREYLQRGCRVFGLSRRGCDGLSGELRDVRCDLGETESIEPALEQLLGGESRLHLVVLNAGVLGRIEQLNRIPLGEIRRVMDINLWANKVIMDWLHHRGMEVGQVVMISSGAAVNGSRGWGGYSLSKAALNMLAKLYVTEFPQTHICALAPGLVHTRMLDDIRDHVDASEFPSAQRLRDAIGTVQMPEPASAGSMLAQIFERLPDYPSGSFLDIRTMDCVD